MNRINTVIGLVGVVQSALFKYRTAVAFTSVVFFQCTAYNSTVWTILKQKLIKIIGLSCTCAAASRINQMVCYSIDDKR